MLLAVTLLILISSFSFDDNVGQTFSVYIISIAGAESVVGLSILVAYYRSLLVLTFRCTAYPPYGSGLAARDNLKIFINIKQSGSKNCRGDFILTKMFK
jgi:hypothetical protein